MAITTPRCLHPMAYRAKNDPGDGSQARCWRPAGHPSDHHLSKPVYLADLVRKNAKARERRAAARRERELKPCGTEAAYKRHIRNGEVPCEECRAEANRISNERRAA